MYFNFKIRFGYFLIHKSYFQNGRRWPHSFLLMNIVSLSLCSSLGLYGHFRFSFWVLCFRVLSISCICLVRFPESFCWDDMLRTILHVGMNLLIPRRAMKERINFDNLFGYWNHIWSTDTQHCNTFSDFDTLKSVALCTNNLIRLLESTITWISYADTVK